MQATFGRAPAWRQQQQELPQPQNLQQQQAVLEQQEGGGFRRSTHLAGEPLAAAAVAHHRFDAHVHGKAHALWRPPRGRRRQLAEAQHLRRRASPLQAAAAAHHPAAPPAAP